MSRKHLYIRFILAFLLIGWNISSFAADTDPAYQIEIIVFSHITHEGLQSEYWPALPPLTISPKAVELTGDQLLPQTQWLLNPAQQLLEKNQYSVLLHLAWQQSAAALRAGQIIHLSGGDIYEDKYSQVNGILAIRLERYFSVHTNLQFLMPWASLQNLNLPNISQSPGNPYMTFNINEHLRMRSNELNYIDHPLYGILIKIVALAPKVT